MSRPFNLFFFMLDDEITRHRNQALVALNALVPALNTARVEGNAAHFDRLAANFRRYRDDALTLDPQAPVPSVSLEFAAPPLAAAA